jgi:hypothetical protein
VRYVISGLSAGPPGLAPGTAAGLVIGAWHVRGVDLQPRAEATRVRLLSLAGGTRSVLDETDATSDHSRQARTPGPSDAESPSWLADEPPR